MITKYLTLISLTCAVSLFSQGNGPGKITQPSGISASTKPDTIYYQSETFASKERIYSITTYNTNLTIQEYRVFHINGQVSYYCQYDYANNLLSKIRYYNAANELTFYGEYSPIASGGTNYNYYNKTGVLLWSSHYGTLLSALDSSWRCEKTITYTAQNQIHSQKLQEYTKDGWLSKEIYLDFKNDTSAIGLWGFDPVSKNTSYTYTRKNNTTIYNQSTNYRYNKYRYYYHASSSNPDSVKTYLNDTLLYTVKFEYDAKGWLLREHLFDKSAIAINRSEYIFSTSTSQTSYKFYREPSELLLVNLSNYSGLQTESGIYSDNQLAYTIRYSYNVDNLYDTLAKVSSSGKLISYETYTYYTPYNLIKKYTSFDSTGKVTSLFNYNEFGVVTDSLTLPTKRYGKTSKLPELNSLYMKGNTVVINVNDGHFVDLSLYSINGRVIGQIKQSVSPGTSYLDFTNREETGSGNYILRGSIGDAPVTRNIKSTR